MKLINLANGPKVYTFDKFFSWLALLSSEWSHMSREKILSTCLVVWLLKSLTAAISMGSSFFMMSSKQNIRSQISLALFVISIFSNSFFPRYSNWFCRVSSATRPSKTCYQEGIPVALPGFLFLLVKVRDSQWNTDWFYSFEILVCS